MGNCSECKRLRKENAALLRQNAKLQDTVRRERERNADVRKFSDQQQLRIKALERENQKLKENRGCDACRKKYQSQLSGVQKKLDKARRDLKAEKVRSGNEMAKKRRNWGDVYDDVEREYRRENNNLRKECDRKVAQAQKAAAKAEAGRAMWRDKHRDIKQENYALKTEIEKRDEQIAKQKRPLNMNSQNSSIPSSQENLTGKPKPKHSIRKSSGRKQGALPGHKPQPRRDLPATESFILQRPEEILNNPVWEKDGKIHSRKIVDFDVTLKVCEYIAEEYRNKETGEKFMVKFPAEFSHNEISYGPEIQALILMLTHVCNVSSHKTLEFLYEATNGALKVSNGFVAGITNKFAERSAAEIDAISQQLALSPVIYADTTVARVNGKRHAVTVNMNDEAALFVYSPHKGEEAVAGTPLADNDGIVVSDCEAVFLQQGSDHQLCLQHLLRDAQDSIENEHNKTWSIKLKSFIERLFHDQKNFGPEGPDAEYKQQVRDELDSILALGQREYEYEPAPSWYPKGQALLSRLIRLKEYMFVYLDHDNVDMTNNRSETALRHIKRKQAQAVTFRSSQGVADLCTVSSVVKTERLNGRRVFPALCRILSKEKSKAG